MANGVDYAFNPHPDLAALKKRGISFVCRYVSSFAPNDTNGKNLVSAERQALSVHGLSIVIVSEEGATRMRGGRAAGVNDAHHADAVCRALGMPTIPVYFACDYDAPERDQPAINAYLDGAASVIGRGRVGIYGGFYPVKRALDARKATFAWQTYAWSGGQWDHRAQIRQVKNGQTVAGASVDLDTSTAADYGQWPRPDGTGPLSVGASGDAVTALQIRLNLWGAEIAVDGVFGSATDAAVRAFQRSHKAPDGRALAVDGVAGHDTVAALSVNPSPSGPAPYPAPSGVHPVSVSVALAWEPVTANGKPVTSYTVQAVGMNGRVYSTTVTTDPSAVLTGLTHGWEYEVRVWANGGATAPPHASVKISV